MENKPGEYPLSEHHSPLLPSGYYEPMLIRWTLGEPVDTPLHAQAFSLLRMSIKFAELLFPDAHKIICHNTLSKSNWIRLNNLSEELDIALFDSTNFLCQHLQEGTVKNSWWKYAPPRLNSNGFELILDNDVILWQKPPTIDYWQISGGVLSLGDRQSIPKTKLYYGAYSSELRVLDPYLDLNAGVLGWPPGFIPPLEQAKGLGHTNDFFNTEQGYSAFLFATYNGNAHLIPYNDVPLICRNLIEPNTLLVNACGAHFCECNFGELTAWETLYLQPLERYCQS